MTVVSVEKENLVEFESFYCRYGSRTVNQNLVWLAAYRDCFLNKNNYSCLLRITNDSETLSFVGLQLEKENMGGLLSIRKYFQFGRGPSDFYSIVVKPGSEEEVVNALANHWYNTRDKWDTITLENIPASNMLPLSLVDKMKDVGFTVEKKEGYGFYTTDTTRDWDKYFETFIRPANKDLLKDLRKLERNGVELSVQTIRKNVYDHLETVLNLYAQRRKSLGQANSYETDERKEFVKRITTAYEESENVELSLLIDSSQNVWAFQLDFLWDGVRYHWNHAYNEDYKKYSPGKILLLKLMEASFKDPSVHEVNHMRGASSYKSKLADTFNPYINIMIINPYSKRLMVRKVWHRLSYLKRWIKL
jgi:hypothetical protein